MIINKRSKPHPELKKLGKLVGIWDVSGEVCGQVSFSWMEGGFFLVQYVDLDGAKGLEFIGYDEESKTLRSHYFDNDGKVMEYTYKVSETEHQVSIDMPGIKGEFKGKYSNNGDTISGSWHWKQGEEHLGYKATLTKIKIN
ncbi:hypothetical protein KXD93_03230 [Mucilaginibacter sp. BJC16-A38]|uniref:hypothetical protein n=1 Tax=Mucilaginibacter phenanthrenivorans TaxID=1234842 RepID=UPI00215839C9|nr:hypothetical protein [Mucilaginibacter phenanthrenivorans]MCR8556634.1 hypothetical protein [Mucilaginibacter phenanthrenivorans]